MQLNRKLPKTSRILTLTRFNSIKNKALMYCEGPLEPSALLALEFDDSIVSYTTQPFSIYYQLNGRRTRYSPDVLAKHDDGSYESIEVKSVRHLNKPKNIHKFNILSELFPREVGHPLTFMTDEDINRGQRLPNYEQLYPYRRDKLTATERQIILKLPTSLTLDELVKHYCQFCVSPFSSAMRLVAHGIFEWNEFKRIDSATALINKGD